MIEEQIVQQIKHSFSQYSLRDIEEINKNNLDFTIAEFILCSCFIDQISGFRYNMKKVGVRYRKFVNEYLPNYNADELYKDLRCKLVHSYSVGKYFGLTRNAHALHLQTQNGIKHLNLEDFIADLKAALNRYILQLDNDLAIRQNAVLWYSKHRIIGLRE